MREYMVRTSHRPRPLPAGRWAMSQRWNDTLFAHWPVSVTDVARLLPDGLQPDIFQGSAWLGIIPHRMDRIKVRGVPAIPGARGFLKLAVRLCVREKHRGEPGIYCLSTETSNLLAVLTARIFCGQPYHWAEMRLEQRTEREFEFYSRRMMASPAAVSKPATGDWVHRAGCWKAAQDRWNTFSTSATPSIPWTAPGGPCGLDCTRLSHRLKMRRRR